MNENEKRKYFVDGFRTKQITRQFYDDVNQVGADMGSSEVPKGSDDRYPVFLH